MAFCRSYKYDIHGNKSIYNHQNNLPWDIVMQGKTFISKYMIDRNVVANASSAIFSRELAMSIDRQYIKMRGNGDWLFWIELMECGNVYFNARELNYFRFHDSNTTKSLGNMGVSAIEFKTIFDYLVLKSYLCGINIRREKTEFLYRCMNTDYKSYSVRRKVLRTWDKYYVFRLYIFFSSIKNDFMLLLRNL